MCNLIQVLIPATVPQCTKLMRIGGWKLNSLRTAWHLDQSFQFRQISKKHHDTYLAKKKGQSKINNLINWWSLSSLISLNKDKLTCWLLAATSFTRDHIPLPFKSLECCTCYWLFCLWVNGGVIWWYKSQSPTNCTLCQNSALRRCTFDPTIFCQQNFQRPLK